MSRINQGLYDKFVSPVVKALSNSATASRAAGDEPGAARAPPVLRSQSLHALGPRAGRQVRATASPRRETTLYVALEHQVSCVRERRRSTTYRVVRDDLQEQMFKAIYESPWLRPADGHRSRGYASARASRTWEQEELARFKRKEIEADIEQGTPLDAWARLLLYSDRRETPPTSAPSTWSAA